MGRPAEGHDLRLIDEAGVEVPPGEAGEVVGHSGGMMTGYHGQPEKTREAEWFAPDGKRFIRTGDIGRFDADGFLTLFDRKKDMIISGGFNIYPSDLEALLREHPAVAEAAVVGVPSVEWGETPVAFVVIRAGSDITAEAPERLAEPARRQDPAPERPAPRARVAAQRHRQGAQARTARPVQRPVFEPFILYSPPHRRSTMTPSAITAWHHVAKNHDIAALKRLLADDVVFESPVVHTPQVGKPITTAYLAAAMQVLGNDSFRYLNEWHGASSSVLEFESTCEGILINGIDMISWNAEGQIIHFKVMVRPLKAVNKLHELMGRMLQAAQQQ